MYLFYVDESGSVADPQLDYFVLAGVAIFDRQTHWLEQHLNAIAERFDQVDPHSLELHGSPMRAGRDGWKRFSLSDRLQAIDDSLIQGVQTAKPHALRVFAAVIKKDTLQCNVDPVMHAFEQLAMRFDQFLGRKYSAQYQRERGIMLFDKSTTEHGIQKLAREFKYKGHTFGKTRNFAEVPVFLDSKASRLIQLADLVAYSIFRKYQYGDARFFDLVKDKFDYVGGVNVSLYEHLTSTPPAATVAISANTSTVVFSNTVVVPPNL